MARLVTGACHLRVIEKTEPSEHPKARDIYVEPPGPAAQLMPRDLKPPLVENAMPPYGDRSISPKLRLALRQSAFLVEESLRDDAAMPVLSRAKILRRALAPKGGSPHGINPICED